MDKVKKILIEDYRGADTGHKCLDDMVNEHVVWVLREYIEDLDHFASISKGKITIKTLLKYSANLEIQTDLSELLFRCFDDSNPDGSCHPVDLLFAEQARQVLVDIASKLQTHIDKTLIRNKELNKKFECLEHWDETHEVRKLGWIK